MDAFEVLEVPAGRLLRGRLRAGLTADDPAVRRFLKAWPGSHALHPAGDRAELLLFAPAAPLRPRWGVHLSLFLLTAASVLLAGSLLAGEEPLAFVGWRVDGLALPVPMSVDLGALWAGAPFAASLLAILLAHELGHYVAARRHRILVTPPFFIPFPAYLSIVGTLGAFIRLRSPVLGRRALVEVGAAGPLAGFFVSVGAAVWGLAQSVTWTGASGGPPAPFVVSFLGFEIWLGGSLLLNGMAAWMVGSGSAPIVLHPIALAGWFGLFVTALNLLPMGQLDGGHILYALSPRAQRWVGRVAFLLLLPLGWAWPGWWVWAVLVFLVGRGRLAHPPVVGSDAALDPRRRVLGGLTLAVLAVTFVPQPFVW